MVFADFAIEEYMADKPFGQWLKDARTTRKMSQQDVADGARVTQAYISKIERLAGTEEEVEVGRDVVEQIALALGVSTEEGLIAAGMLPKTVRRRAEVVRLSRGELAEILRRGGGDKLSPSMIDKIARGIEGILPLIDAGEEA